MAGKPRGRRQLTRHQTGSRINEVRALREGGTISEVSDDQSHEVMVGLYGAVDRMAHSLLINGKPVAFAMVVWEKGAPECGHNYVSNVPPEERAECERALKDRIEEWSSMTAIRRPATH